MIMLGAAFQTRQRLEEAIGVLQEALVASDKLPNRLVAAGIHERLADIANLSEDWTTATEHMETAMKLYAAAGVKEGQASMLLTRGEMARARDQLDDAAAAYRDALTMGVEIGSHAIQFSATIGLGRTMQLRNELEQASGLFESAVQLPGADPDDVVDALLSLAAVRGALGEHVVEEQHLMSAERLATRFELGAKLPEIRMCQGDARSREGRRDAAIESYRDAEAGFRRIEAIDRVVQAILAQAGEHAQSDLDQAVLEAGRAVDVAHEHNDAVSEVTALITQSGYYSDAGCDDEAIARARRAVAIAPWNTTALGTLGNALLQAGRFDESISASEDALALDSTQVWIILNVGHATLGLGDPSTAEENYRRAIELAGPLEDFASDVEDIEKLLQRDPELPRARDFLEMFRDKMAAHKARSVPPRPSTS
jgi:tetratricopeptide (TPR) repeat protein